MLTMCFRMYNLHGTYPKLDWLFWM